MNEEDELAGAGISKNSNFDKQKSSTSNAPF
jgi:hypothetical protein